MIVKKKNKPLEKEIQNQICEFLKLKNVFFWRSNNVPIFGRNNGGQMTYRKMGKYALKGTPDIIAIIGNGKFVGIEVKRPGLGLSEDQVAFAKRCIAEGGLYIIATSVQDVENALIFPGK